jgi:hypothetical protein
MFSEVEVVVGGFSFSNHFSLFMCLTAPVVGDGSSRPFRYEAQWALDEGYWRVIEEAWESLTPARENWERC